MDIDSLRRHCLSFPHTTENVQWGADLCFKVDGKLFAVAPLEVAPVPPVLVVPPDPPDELEVPDAPQPARSSATMKLGMDCLVPLFLPLVGSLIGVARS